MKERCRCKPDRQYTSGAQHLNCQENVTFMGSTDAIYINKYFSFISARFEGNDQKRQSRNNLLEGCCFKAAIEEF